MKLRAILLTAIGSTATIVGAASSPDGLWVTQGAAPANRASAFTSERWISPAVGQYFVADPVALESVLRAAPAEFSRAASSTPQTIHLPTPDGDFIAISIVDSPVMEAELAQRFPEIRTFSGRAVEDPSLDVRLDWTPQGFHASVLSPEGVWYVDPVWRNDNTEYVSYRKADYKPGANAFRCLVDGGTKVIPETKARPERFVTNGTTRRNFRLACAATGEYTAFHGGSVLLGQAAIVTAVNRMNQVYLAELAVTMTLVANNSLLVYTNGATDPYTNNDGVAMLDENILNVESVIGGANYDIGHVFSTGGGGVAYVGVVCNSSFKAGGVTGDPNPVNDPFVIDYVCHEIGHQFGGTHTFNSALGSCNGSRASSSAFEPGSGTTIMAYAGICGADNLQPNSDAYFHSRSLEEIIGRLGSSFTCATSVTTGNIVPTISAGPDVAIPTGTPFVLSATGSDGNGDTLRFAWEQRSLGASQSLTAADNGASPLFRSFTPSTLPARFFPQLANLLNNTSSSSERMPTVARSAMEFIVVARDNNPNGGAVNSDSMLVTVVNTGSPFTVTAPNTAGTWTNPSQTVTWNVAGTTAAPISATNVRILLSSDGGATFPTILVASTPNDGSETVSVSSTNNSTQARIRVEPVSGVFFDVSNANFTINAPTLTFSEGWAAY